MSDDESTDDGGDSPDSDDPDSVGGDDLHDMEIESDEQSESGEEESGEEYDHPDSSEQSPLTDEKSAMVTSNLKSRTLRTISPQSRTNGGCPRRLSES